MRALVASFGASAALVAGAAVALLFVSLLVGYDGFTGYLDGSTQQAAIRVSGADAASPSAAARRSRAAAPIVVAAPRPRASKPAAPPVVRRHATQGVRTGSADALTLTPPTVASGEADATPATPPKTATKPTVGDGVRQLGDDVSSTVQHTGDATGAVTKVLGPPVSAAVQKVLDLISTLLKKTTSGLGSAVDAILPQQR
ncbi:MAG TPA: hypothetical protein VHZ31_02725 [Solirubrobacteraceae bacterium]|nr:hypothetical protein [Solirubrobacteraceae bacterium]